MFATEAKNASRADASVLLGIAGPVTLAHVPTNTRYGFHRDELQFLSDARHLAWGYVSYPPFTPFVERLGLVSFGASMVGLRIFSVIAHAAAIVVTGLMAGERARRRSPGPGLCSARGHPVSPATF